MSLEIYIDPAHKERGYCGVHLYSDGDCTITTGSSNEGGMPLIRRMSIHMRCCDVTIYGGTEEYVAVHSLVELHRKHKDIPEVNAWMWSTFLKHLTPEIFKQILGFISRTGFSDGEESAKSSIRYALGIEDTMSY